VADSQSFDPTANSTLAKLVEVDSELAVTEAELLSQLESVQEKRRSLKTVICLFTKPDTPVAEPLSSPAQTSAAVSIRVSKPVDFNLAAPTLETPSTTATTEDETEASPDTKSITQKTAPTAIRRNKPTKFTHPVKAGRKVSGWQQYVRAEFSNTPLSEAVSLVLQHQADKVFEIPAIVNAIFVDELPKEVGTKARRQVTNILSSGVRKSKWYRGQLGYYSMSRAAAQANSS